MLQHSRYQCSFLNADDKNLYRKRLDDTYNRLKFSQATKSEILKVQTKLGEKKTYRRWIELKKKKKKKNKEAILQL